MRMHLVRPRDLDTAAIARWREIQQAEPSLASPYFSPEFTQAVAAVRDDVYVTLLEEGGRLVGFFPFQRRWGAGLPVGGRLSDHHGVVALQGTRWDWRELLQACGLGYWEFDHLAAWQQPGGTLRHCVSHALDLTGGYEGYRQARIDGGSETILKLERRARKLEREVGPMRFVANTADAGVLQTIIDLKREQCRRTGALEYFAWPWTRGLVEELRAMDGADFGGRLSALYVGDTLVAAHFGIRSQWVWHGWFTVYQAAWATWSPGSLLLLAMARAAAQEGHRLLDLGKGEEAFKKVFGNCTLPLVEGCVSRPAWSTAWRSTGNGARRWMHSSPLGKPLRPLVRAARRRAAALLAPG